MEFGQYIRELRKKKKMSASELARRAGISQPYLSQLETGKNRNPTTMLLMKLAKGLGVPSEDLLLQAGYISEDVWTDKKDVEEYNENRKEHGLADIKDLNKTSIIFDDIIEAARLNTDFIYDGEKLNLDEKMFIANVLRTVLQSDIPEDTQQKEKAIDLIKTILK